MSYDPNEGGGVVFAGNNGSSASSVAGQNPVIFTFQNAVGACISDSTNTIIVNHVACVCTADIATYGSSAQYNIWTYGFSNSNIITGSHIRNQYTKSDDNTWGVLRKNSTDLRTTNAYRALGTRNYLGLDQLAGVII